MAKMIELTEEQLDAKIAAATAAGMNAGMEAFEARMRRRDEEMAHKSSYENRVNESRGKHLPQVPVELVPGCIAPSGATFTAEVQHGKVVQLRDYMHPAGTDVFISDGGLLPDGHIHLLPDSKTEAPRYKQWKYEQFLQSDTRLLVGKPLPRHVRPENAG